ncbi:hypothetical protein KEM54_005140, partial [Ascosphaera aggregata]
LSMTDNCRIRVDNLMRGGIDLPGNIYVCRYTLGTLKQVPEDSRLRAIRDRNLTRALKVSLEYFTICNMVTRWEPIKIRTIRSWAGLSPIDPVISYAYQEADRGLDELNIPLNQRPESLWPGANKHYERMHDYWVVLYESFIEGALVIE